MIILAFFGLTALALGVMALIVIVEYLEGRRDRY